MAGLDDMTATLPPSMRLPTPLVIRPVGSRKRPCSCVFVATVCNCQRTLEYVLESMARAHGAVFDTIAFIISYDTARTAASQSWSGSATNVVTGVIENVANDSPYHAPHRPCAKRHHGLHRTRPLRHVRLLCRFRRGRCVLPPLRLEVLIGTWMTPMPTLGTPSPLSSIRYHRLPHAILRPWALQFGFFVHNVFGWGEHSQSVLGQVMHEMLIGLDAAPPGSLIPAARLLRLRLQDAQIPRRSLRCERDAHRTGVEVAVLQTLLEGLSAPLTRQQIRPNENEHIAFHVGATARHGAKVVIANETAFGPRVAGDS